MMKEFRPLPSGHGPEEWIVMRAGDCDAVGVCGYLTFLKKPHRSLVFVCMAPSGGGIFSKFFPAMFLVGVLILYVSSP